MSQQNIVAHNLEYLLMIEDNWLLNEEVWVMMDKALLQTQSFISGTYPEVYISCLANTAVVLFEYWYAHNKNSIHISTQSLASHL